jgi:hypothetical protein
MIYSYFEIISERVDRIIRIRGSKGSSKVLKNYRRSQVWQMSSQLCLAIYKTTRRFPDEGYGLTSQICRCEIVREKSSRPLEPLTHRTLCIN